MSNVYSTSVTLHGLELITPKGVICHTSKGIMNRFHYIKDSSLLSDA